MALPVGTRSLPRETVDIARAWIGEFGRIALATVIGTWGSSPVPVGGMAVIASGDRFEGSVSGGCVEADVIVEAESVIATGRPKTLEFGVSNETAWRAGLPCGGTLEIFLEPLDAAEDRSYLDAIISARDERRAIVVKKNLSDGSRSVSEIGFAAAGPLASRVVEEDGARYFVHAHEPPVHVIVIGATHVGQVLADLSARVGFKVTVIDPRTGFLTEERFHGVDQRAEWPGTALAAMGLDPRTAVVALTHMGHVDDEALLSAITSNCLYIGALGSKRTHASRVERLRAAGASDSELARIRAPIGLPIGAKGPAEIAVAILAEIVKAHRLGNREPLSV